MDDIRIRNAATEDAERLGRLGCETFTETFGHLYRPEDLDAFLGEAHAPARYRAFATDPAFRLWVAAAGDEDLGYALAGPCHLPHPEVGPSCGELWRLYVKAKAQGAGLGGRLLSAALSWLEAPGRRLWLGVWSGNLSAQQIYARYGFEQVGEYEFPVGAHRDREFIFARPAC